MPTLSTPSLTLGTTTNGKRDVTVAGNVTFSASDVGKAFRLEIKVYGEDKAGDNLPAGDAVGDDLLYTYRWPGPIFSTAFKTITAVAAGTVPFTEKRAIETDTLDEDAGKVKIGMADINTPIYAPRQDEVYARVAVSTAPSAASARTPTVTVGIGV